MAALQALAGFSPRPKDAQALRRLPLSVVVVVVSLAHLGLGLLALRPSQVPLAILPPQPVSVRWLAPPAPPQPVVQPAQPQPQQTPVHHLAVRPRPAVIAAAAPVASPAEPAIAPAPVAPPAPARAPEALVLPSAEAAYLSNPPPAYPAAALGHHDQGRVMLRVLVSAEGQPREVVVDQGSGFDALDAAALAAVRGWRFTPGRRGDTAVEAWVLIPISFTVRTR